MRAWTAEGGGDGEEDEEDKEAAAGRPPLPGALQARNLACLLPGGAWARCSGVMLPSPGGALPHR